MMKGDSTFLALTAARRRSRHKVLRRVPFSCSAAPYLVAIDRRRRSTSPSVRSGVMAEIAHAGTLPNGSISEPHSEQLHPPIRARPRVMAVVAAMGAPPRHPVRSTAPRSPQAARIPAGHHASQSNSPWHLQWPLAHLPIARRLLRRGKQTDPEGELSPSPSCGRVGPPAPRLTRRSGRGLKLRRSPRREGRRKKAIEMEG